MPAATLVELDDDDTIVPISDMAEALPADRSKKVSLALLAQFLSQTGQVVAPKSVAFAQTPYAVLAADEVLLVSTAGGAVTVTLPAAPTAGRILNIKRTTTDANAVTVARNTKSIEGAAANLSLTGGNTASVTLQYDAATLSWWIL